MPRPVLDRGSTGIRAAVLQRFYEVRRHATEHRLEELSTTSHGVLVAPAQLLNHEMRRLHFDGDGLEDRP